MSNLVSFPNADGDAENVIERLEEVLEMAKRGELANVMIIAVDHKNDVYHGWANGNRPSLILGEAYCAMYEFMSANTQRRGEA